MIRAFPAGHAVVMLPNGEQLKVVFHQRESQHPSNTPTVRALMRRLFPPQPEQESAPEQQPTPITRKPRARKVVVQSIHAALEHDSDLSPMELAARIGCDLDTAKAARMSYFYGSMATAQ